MAENSMTGKTFSNERKSWSRSNSRFRFKRSFCLEWTAIDFYGSFPGAALAPAPARTLYEQQILILFGRRTDRVARLEQNMQS